MDRRCRKQQVLRASGASVACWVATKYHKLGQMYQRNCNRGIRAGAGKMNISAGLARFLGGPRPHPPPESIMAASDYEVFDERFRDCVNRTSHVEKLWTGARWTEGPVYFPAGRYTLFSDIP